ncbi:hypothetical protein R1sor_020848 [Riccia sorocarpa]|uniref:Uncharacterized protein n=1 Tax=Riccia sorocarpa TaxID=122646 RepID=A0ABD3GH52_9MARC
MPMMMIQNLKNSKAVEMSLSRTTMAKHHSRSVFRRMMIRTTRSTSVEIREALRAPVEPVVSEAQHIICFVVGVESSAPRTIVPHPSLQRAILVDPQPSTVLQAIPLDPPSIVLHMRFIPLDPQPSDAQIVTPRIVIPQPSTVRAVVSDPSCARTTAPELFSRQTRAQTQSASARGTEERRAKKSKK